MNKLTDDIKQNAYTHGGLPFWSWNDKLNEEELRRQIQNMKDINMRGFFMHARGGLMTEYCGDDWYKCINACVDEAKKLGMEAWAYDENGWPSGFAGGKLLKDKKNLATYLLCEKGAFRWDALAVYVADHGAYRQVSAPEDAPEDAPEYVNILQGYDPAYVDVTDAEITDQFIQATYAEYKEKVGDEFGKTMPGFFTDEPQYYRWHTPWSNKMPQEFQVQYGYSVFDALPALFLVFEGAVELRYDYWNLLHRLYTENFIKRIAEWCDRNGVMVTGHTIEESTLAWQMLCSGGVMPFYEFEQIPGIDHLGRNVKTDLPVKQIGSVAAQLNKKKVLSEMYALCGWDVTPAELKNIAQWQYVAGVNLTCSHLYPYSERGERKYDYPAHYSEHLPWNSYLKEFNQYFANLGYTLSLGTEQTNVLLIHPMHSAYLNFRREEWDSSVQPLEEKFHAIFTGFGDHQVQYHFGDETILRRHGSVKGKKLVVGQCTYDTVVLPGCETLDSSTVALLREFVANGGNLLVEGGAPERIDGRNADLSFLRSNITFEDILSSQSAVLSQEGHALSCLRMNVKNTPYGKLFYVVNLSAQPLEHVRFLIKGVTGVTEINMLTLAETPCSFQADGTGILLDLHFDAYQSYLFLESKNAVSAPSAVEKIGLTATIPSSGFRFVTLPENCLTLDFAALSYDGVTFEDPMYIMAIRDRLLRERYQGDISLKFSFEAACRPENLLLCVEPMDFHTVSVNGQNVEFNDQWRIDRRFRCADIAANTVFGKNELVLTFSYFQRPEVFDVLFGGTMESLRNSMYLDTEPESVYLFGSFCVKAAAPFTFSAVQGGKHVEGLPDNQSINTSVCSLTDGGFSLIPQKSEIDLSNVVTDGYPFFAGAMVVEKTFDWQGSTTAELSLAGRYAIGEITLNGVPKTTLLFENHGTVTGLQKGKNTLRLKLLNSLRNTLGPLHHPEDECLAVCPDSFTFEGRWKDGQCESFKKRYSFVNFGVSQITLTEK